MTKQDIAYINEHRAAIGRPKLKIDDETEVRRHLDLIALFAPYGVDPWGHYDVPSIIEISEQKPNDLKGHEVYTAVSRSMTTAKAFLKIKAPELVLTLTDGEYRVNKRGGREATAAYTNDLADALATGLAMARKGVW